MALEKKRALVVPESTKGVCIWKFSNGYVADNDNNYLSLEGVIGDTRVEERMREAVRSYLGDEIAIQGEPKWISGARKITDSEYEDQMDRLQSGKIPDEVEEYKLSQKGEA